MKELKQLARELRISFLIFMVVCCLYFAYILVPHPLVLAFSAIEIYPNVEENVDMVSTTLYTTLITINLSLVALSVTVYIFLMSALEQSEDYEREIVRQMRAFCTRWLLCQTGFTGVCIILALIADNEINQNFYGRCIRYGIISVLFVAVIAWIIYIAYVIRYDAVLAGCARESIEQTIKKMYVADIKNDEKGTVDSDNDIIKQIGDIELLIRSVLNNHRNEFRGIDSSSLTLIQILEQKEKLKDKTGPKVPTSDDDRVETTKVALRKIDGLIEIRNCMWVIQARGKGESEILFEPDRNRLKRECEMILESFLKYMAEGEVFGDIGLSAVDLSGADFKSSSFQGALLNGTTLAGADISYADFSGGRFQDIGWNNQKDNTQIVCNNAVFEKVKFIRVNLQNANCKNAVFRDAELSDVLLSGDEKDKAHFEGANFEHANFMDVGHKIEFADFAGAVFGGALLSVVTFSRCNFKGADFSDAICQSTEFQECDIEDGNLERISAYGSTWKSVTIPRGRVAHANFAGATLKECDLRSAYVNDSTYTNGKLTKCHFEGTVFRRADFTGAEITECWLHFADLQEAVFNGDFPPAKTDDERVLVQVIRNCQFDGANLSNAQIRNCKFSNCSFTDCFFDSALLQSVTFESCSFANAQFEGTVIMDVTFETTGDERTALKQQLRAARICKGCIVGEVANV